MEDCEMNTATSSLSERNSFRLLVGAVFVGVLIRRLARFDDPFFLGTFSDDYFYYLKIADNIVSGEGSTFDGTIHTNGYHPLWMWTAVGLLKVLHDNHTVLVAVAVLIAIATSATFALSWMLVKRVAGYGGLGAAFIAAYAALYFYVVAKHGMEIVATVPLMLLFVRRLLSDTLDDPRSVFITGLLGSLVVLSRLDTMLYLFLFGVGWLASAPGARSSVFRNAPYFVAGLVLLVPYFAFNLVAFGGPLPVSGAAKQLAPSAFRNFGWRNFEVTHRLHLAFVYPSVVLAFLAIVTLIAARRTSSSRFEARTALAPVLVFPVLFLLMQTTMSDWPLWDWYLYPFIVATPIAAAVVTMPFRERIEAFHDRLAVSGKLGSRMVQALALAIVAAGCVAWRAPIERSSIQDSAYALSDFARAHPGRYAMGDRAGMTSMVMPYPLLQLEGLVGDRAYLGNIRAERRLFDVLDDYRIDYYISSDARPEGECFRTEEPRKAGATSPRMRAFICRRPVFSYEAPEDGHITMIFALHPSPELRAERGATPSGVR
jgi:hypothetical protein